MGLCSVMGPQGSHHYIVQWKYTWAWAQETTWQVSLPPLASVHPCKMGLLMPTVPTLWGYREYRDFILSSPYSHKVYLPH